MGTKKNKKIKKSNKTKYRFFNKKNNAFTPINKIEVDFSSLFLRLLIIVKLFHWETYSYAQHKSSDDLYSKLNEHIDKFMEVLLGKEVYIDKTSNRIKFPNEELIMKIPIIDNRDEMVLVLSEYKGYLTNIEDIYKKEFSITKIQDLMNIRDEILADINQFSYLLTFE